MNLESRISGFASANNKKFESANSAYKHFLNAIGDESPEAKPDFKEFLETAKKTGDLDNMLKVEGVKEKPIVQDTAAQTTEQKKNFKNPAKTIGLIVLGVAIVGTVIYFATRPKKQ